MSRRQGFAAPPKAKCVRCLYTKPCLSVTQRILPPSGGHVCEECLIPAAIEAQKSNDKRVEAILAAEEKAKEPKVICPECKMISYNPNDIKMGYCGNCEWWTSDPILRKVPKKDRA